MAGRLQENPFYVLGLRPGCSRSEIEREGQKLLGMLELGLSAARRYDTPLGAQPRDAERVRWAMAELREPARRLVHELWAWLPAQPLAGPPGDADAALREGLAGAGASAAAARGGVGASGGASVAAARGGAEVSGGGAAMPEPLGSGASGGGAAAREPLATWPQALLALGYGSADGAGRG